MTTASNNGTQSRAPLAVVTEKVHAMLTTSKNKKDRPVNHSPRTVAIPSGMSETAFLVRLAHKGATIVTDMTTGARVAQIGHAVRMVTASSEHYTVPAIAPRNVARRVGSVSGVSLSRVLGESNADLARGNASDY
jgi:hypothetical protein